MFDFAWSEIALIGVVALVAIGPKDMPVAIKAISDTIKKMRRMAGEFQGHVDEMLRDANLTEAKSTFDELRGMNVKSAMRRAIDPDGTLKSAFADPFRDHPVKPVMTPLDQTSAAQAIAGRAAAASDAPAPAFVAPAFSPPNAARPAPIQPVEPAPQAAPAFIPPAAKTAD
jgi:sec-independent protein translocase protein TatB